MKKTKRKTIHLRQKKCAKKNRFSKKCFQKGAGSNSHLNDEKGKSIIKFTMFPSALHGDKKMIAVPFLTKEFPSYQSMYNSEVGSVEELLAYIKANSKPKTHSEVFVLSHTYDNPKLP